MWTITYTIVLSDYPHITITSDASQSFKIEVRDPCKVPLLTFIPSVLTPRTYTLKQFPIGPFDIEPFTISSAWCAYSYSPFRTDDSNIDSAITFNTAADPPQFTYYSDSDLQTGPSQHMMADSVVSKVYTITVEGISDTLTVTSDFTLTILNPCFDSTITFITAPSSLDSTHDFICYIGAV